MSRDEWDDQEDFERYAEWELEAPAFPPRSQLYALEPVGVGTPEVECLTSYLTRLAGEHHVLTGNLLGNVLTPRFNKPSWVRHGSPNLGTLYSGAGALNGVGSQASEWVELLEDLTKRTDVQALTLLIWAEVLPSKELMRPTRAWCSACYQEWRIQGQVIYEPLLWTLGVVTACARHRRRLQVQCPTPACQRSIPWLASHARPGYCSSCQEWLGEAKAHRPTKQERLSEEETAWQSWVAQVVGELLAHNAALSTPPQRERVPKTLLVCIQQITNGKKDDLCAALGVQLGSVPSLDARDGHSSFSRIAAALLPNRNDAARVSHRRGGGN